MATRRDFLRRTSLAIAGGLVVGDAALELFERLTHKKVWALGPMPYTVDITTGATGGMFSAILEPVRRDTVIRRVIIDGADADHIEQLGVGPSGGVLIRAWRDLGGAPMYTVNGALIRNNLPPAVRGIHAQLEDSRWPTSPIVTYKAPATRAPDVLRFPWEVRDGVVQMTHPLPGSTPMRYDHAGRLLRESSATNYVLHSGDPRALSSEGK